MTIKVAISHKTTYRFDRMVDVLPHLVRLRPAPHCRTPIESYSLKVEPGDHFINWQQDPFANYLARLVFPERVKSLSLEVELIADMTVINPFDFFVDENADHFPLEYDEQLKIDLAPYLNITEKNRTVQDWLAAIDLRRQPIVDFLVQVNARLQREIKYEIRLEPGVQSCEQTLNLLQGSCRDTAWLLVQLFRHLGLAARFVSGYLVQLTADVKALDGPSGPTEDFTDLHAWTEVYIPGAGWLGLDPTSGLLAAEGHIPLACTPDPVSAAAVTGATSRCEVTFEYANQVTRIHEDPRVTKPFSPRQWRQIDDLGNRVDQEFDKHEVHLTMGGEPTFISIDDMESAQWNIAAMGDEKRRLAGKLLHSLKQEFGQNGLVHYGQGKWYPGEPVPRWALALYWRTDTKALWHDTSLLIDDDSGSGTATDGDAKKFITSLAGRLEVEKAHILPGYEDTKHYLEVEGALPFNVDVSDSRLKDPLERDRLRRVFDRGLDKVVGYTLPLAHLEDNANAGWRSCRWQFTREHLFLVPGDSPMGFRLPLDSLPWEAPEKKHQEFDQDPFAEDEPLQGDEQSVAQQQSQNGSQHTETIFHTALCTEIRNSRLYVFLPPLKKLNQWIELLAAIEATAKQMNCPVVIEGYEAPRDSRLRKLMITPDPGVIEVNVHPAHNWKELLSIIHPLYNIARQNRLGTEKFMLDGKHTGTGGGNHVTLGAAKPEDSPFLRRPDLLGSMLRFWQNHPSLSYLFSGQFIGPTSQSPRVDEARDDNLYELEIALQQLVEGETAQPWMVDRILRNFLVDLTGNTHRAEFCIDKLYSPDSATGRLGLVEFRNFEMPPHWQMSALQMLLIRALVSYFWQHPYRKPLINWGTELHDRFMLPHFVWQDLSLVIEELRASDYPFELDWFASFQEFRFPSCGSIHVAGVELEVRNAIEPWHVLGEESDTQGTSRYVDSSVERLQVTARNMTGNRFMITCNARKLPLQFSGREGEYIAGVRYKAWSPWSALHPTLPVNSPLVFDIVDTFNNHSLGGCTYHVAHPGGRNYDTFPVNANEAEARRVARFWHHGHSQGQMDVRTDAPHPNHPYTLDLRFGVGQQGTK
ncbi:MAG: transglutaminase family protein [Pseudohongiellaceae bacterium]